MVRNDRDSLAEMHQAADSIDVADTIEAIADIATDKNVTGKKRFDGADHAPPGCALDAQTGARVWLNDHATGVTELVLWREPAHAPRDGVGPAEPARKLLFASSGTTGLWALATEDGREIWRRRLPEGGASAPVPVAGALLVSTTRYGLFLLSTLDGAVIDGLDLANGLSMTPAVVGRRAFVMSNTGIFLGLDVEPPVATGTNKCGLADGH